MQLKEVVLLQSRVVPIELRPRIHLWHAPDGKRWSRSAIHHCTEHSRCLCRKVVGQCGQEYFRLQHGAHEHRSSQGLHTHSASHSFISRLAWRILPVSQCHLSIGCLSIVTCLGPVPLFRKKAFYVDIVSTMRSFQCNPPTLHWCFQSKVLGTTCYCVVALYVATHQSTSWWSLPLQRMPMLAGRPSRAIAHTMMALCMLPFHRPSFPNIPCPTVLNLDPLPHAKPETVIFTPFGVSSSHVHMYNIHSTGRAALHKFGLGPQHFASVGNLSRRCVNQWRLLHRLPLRMPRSITSICESTIQDTSAASRANWARTIAITSVYAQTSKLQMQNGHT